MKKFIMPIFFMLAVILPVALFAGCGETYTVEYACSDGGYIDGDAKQTVRAGDTGTEVTAVALDGYTFLEWSDGNASPTRVERNVASDIWVVAIFEKPSTNYRVVYEAEDGGSISGVSAQLVTDGGDATAVSAVADDGYVFIGWSDGVQTKLREDKNICGDILVTAKFRKQFYEVNYAAGKGGSIDGETNQTVAYGKAATTVTATPDLGYKFVRWSDTGSVDPVRTDIDVDCDINARADFSYLRPDGKGVEGNPVLINNYAELYDMCFYSHMHYKLNADIDLAGVDFKPPFKTYYPFTGILDGGGHYIKNMTVAGDFDAPSLLGYVDGGVVKNLNVTDFRIAISDVQTSRSKLVVGAVAGSFFGTLENVSASGRIEVNGEDFGLTAIGGLVGHCYGKVTNCRAQVEFDSTKMTTVNEGQTTALNVGGMIGVGLSVEARSCESRGTIGVKEHSRNLNVGGFAGVVIVDDGESALFDGNAANVDISCDIANVGGFVGRVLNYDCEFSANNCRVNCDINCKGFVGGFAAYVDNDSGGEIALGDCRTDGDIKGNCAAGFIYTVNNTGRVGIENCGASVNVAGSMCAGFCYYARDGVRFYRCFGLTEIDGKVMTAGFVFDLRGGCVEECFSQGSVTATYQASGFIFFANYGTAIKNCYSYSDVIITNTDETAETRTFACGFIVSAGYKESVTVSDCIYLGNISGHVYTTSSASGMGSIVAAFIGDIYGASTMENCHCYLPEDSFAKVSATNRTPNILYINEYGELSDGAGITDALCRDGQNDVWTAGENGLPKLKFFA